MKSCATAEATSKMPPPSLVIETGHALLPAPPAGATARALRADYGWGQFIPPSLFSSLLHAFVICLAVMISVVAAEEISSPLPIDTRALTPVMQEKQFEVRKLEEPKVLPKLGTKENLAEKIAENLADQKQAGDNLIAAKGEKATAADFEAKEVKPVVQPEESAKVRSPDVIYVPTPQAVVDEMLRLAKVKSGDIVMDLGCGDGRIPIAAAKLGAWGFGYELQPNLIKDSLENAKKAGVAGRVVFEQRDVFKLDLSRADVVTLYLLPSLNVKLIPQLQRMKPGTRVVSHDFDMDGIKPDLVKRFQAKNDGGDQREHTIYLWTLPLRKENGELLTPEPDPTGPLTVTEDEVLWTTLGLKLVNVQGGLNVKEVRAGGPAARAGIKVDDLLVMLGGFDVSSKRGEAVYQMRLNFVYMSYRAQRGKSAVDGSLHPDRWDR